MTCSEVTLNLTAYSGNATNEVTVSVVGGDDLLATTKFGREYSTKTPLQLPEHDKELTVRLVVKAGDDDKYSFNDTKTAPVCEDDTPSPTPTEATPSEAPSTEPCGLGDPRAECDPERDRHGSRACPGGAEQQCSGPRRDRFVVRHARHRWSRCGGSPRRRRHPVVRP